MGAVGGYAAAGASLLGAGSLAVKGFGKRNMARNAVAGLGSIGEALEDTGKVSSKKAASTGKAIAKATTGSSGRSVSALPMPSPTGSGALVNPSAGAAVTRASGVTPAGLAAYEAAQRRPSANPLRNFPFGMG